MKLNDGNHVTRDGATVGTFDYVSPEQARHSHSVDIRGDIYSLGCTLYHMIAGRVPFPGGSLAGEALFASVDRARSLNDVVQGVPDGLVRVISRMMSKIADDRFATPSQVAHALEPFAEDLPPSGVLRQPSAQRLPDSGDEPGIEPDPVVAEGVSTALGPEFRTNLGRAAASGSV